MVPLGVSSSLFTGELPFQVMTRAKGVRVQVNAYFCPLTRADNELELNHHFKERWYHAAQHSKAHIALKEIVF